MGIMDSLRDEIMKLPAPEKIRIANALYESIVSDPNYEFELTPEQRLEFECRLEVHRKNPNDYYMGNI